MIKSNIPLIQIADELGFCSQSHFSQRFKRETGMTPTQFKNS
jgi:AraC-like DNA-binding protein